VGGSIGDPIGRDVVTSLDMLLSSWGRRQRFLYAARDFVCGLVKKSVFISQKCEHTFSHRGQKQGFIRSPLVE
jgi:hypothetical protein